MIRLTWTDCYESGWRGLITDKAFAHPAKYARGLIERIVEFGFQEGLWQPGDLIGDPFAGIGTGGIICDKRGLRWIGVELEPRFVRMAGSYDCPGISRAEWLRWYGRFRRCEYVCPACQDGMGILQGGRWGLFDTDGDGRYYRDGRIPWRRPHRYKGNFEHARVKNAVIVQGDSRHFPRILQAAGIITSPPYAECIRGEHAERETASESRDKRRTGGGSLGRSQRHGGYGGPQNIGNLKQGELSGVVTSLPWEQCLNDGANHARMHERYPGWGKNPDGSNRMAKSIGTTYGESQDNLGNASGETYWQAVSQVYQQCRLALKPGGTIVIVVKDYVKNKRRVPLCRQTRRLLYSLGFKLTHRIKASLVKETRTEGLFGEVVKRTERKSFFRRLAEKKGSPHIDHEEVIVAKKPQGLAP